MSKKNKHYVLGKKHKQFYISKDFKMLPIETEDAIEIMKLEAIMNVSLG